MSLLQHYSLKTSIPWHFAFFTVQFSQPYMTTGKTVALIIWTFCRQSNVFAFQHTVQVCHRLPTKQELSSDFMATVTVRSDFGVQEEKSVTTFTFFPSICCAVIGPDAMTLVFLTVSLKLALSLSFTLIKRLFCSSSLSAIRMILSTYLRLLMFLLPILISACNSSSPAFLMMCLVYRLNKQGVSKQLGCILSPS